MYVLEPVFLTVQKWVKCCPNEVFTNVGPVYFRMFYYLVNHLSCQKQLREMIMLAVVLS